MKILKRLSLKKISIAQSTRHKLKKLNSFFFPNDLRADHFKALDGLRGVAVLLVLLSHASNDELYLLPGLNFSGMGKVGVILFFVLSAYLLDRQIIIGFIHKKSSTRFWMNYFLRRFLRIYPLYFIALLAFYIGYQKGLGLSINSFYLIQKHLLLQEGLDIFWSIVVEFKYYFISPLIMAFCNYILKWDLTKVCLFILGLIAIAMLLEGVFRFELTSLIRYLPIFLIGTILSVFEVLLEKKLHLKTFESRRLEMAGLVSFGLIIISTPTLFAYLFLHGKAIMFGGSPIFYVPYALLWAVVLVATKYGSLNILKSFFQIFAFRLLGVISFSAYLFHIIILKAIQLPGIQMSNYLRAYFFIMLACIISLFTYTLIEKPLQKVRISY